MSRKPFRIHLPERRTVNATIAEFLLRRKADASELARRARVLAALAELPARRRNELERAVAQVCRTIAARGGTATVRFALTQHRGRRFVEVSVCDRRDRPSSPAPAGDATITQEAGDETGQTSIQRVGELLDHFEASGGPVHGAVIRMGQVLSPSFNAPTESEVSRWADMLATRSAEDALILALQHCHSVSVGLSDARDRENVYEQLGPDTVAEDLTMLSLVASKTRNAISIMEADGRISWVNEAFVQMTGYSPFEASGKRLDQLLFGPSTDADAVREFQQALRDGRELAQDVLLYRRDGRTFWSECNVIPVRDQNGELTRWISIDIDITKRRQTEDALRQAKEHAEAGSRVKSEFLANMSHEIRTPLNSIIGMTELALTTELSPEQRGYLQTVESSAQSLLRLLNDILDLSKIEAGKMSIEQVPFQLADVIRDTLGAMTVKAQEKGLELAVKVPTHLPKRVVGDPGRLQQILFNLVGNAIKFTNQGQVVVEAEEQWRSEQEVGLHFWVRDTGTGIPPEKLTQIFEAFTQADSAITRQYGGTGLGLTITAELIRLMHGKIWVQSVVGKGSTFHFTLRMKLPHDGVWPESPEARQAAPDVPPTADRQATVPLRVLVVDDHAANRHLATTVLTKRGHQCVDVADGNQALEALDRQPFDVALLDVQMPKMDGYETARAIREKEKGTGRHLPIIALTAHAMTGDREKCLAAGMDAYLAKPLRPRNLVQMVESIAPAASGKRDQEAARSGSDTPHLPPPYDLDAALESMDHDLDLLLQQMEFFIDDGPRLVRQIREAIAGKDRRNLELAAHRLKGLVARYAAHEAVELAYSLEQKGKDRDFCGAQEVAEQIAPLVDQLVEALRQYVAEHSGPPTPP